MDKTGGACKKMREMTSAYTGYIHKTLRDTRVNGGKILKRILK
jgi:hypothetical protein